ncbi:hypothetical protein [Serratia fonticola]|uniref:hypothetical protein n=1 Tax=Serratia fonticola TaxID=47917 RepID=UPI0015C62FCA|nr:hypothetical protein [Serratia fonticola]NYA16483.1 hypothetical protein [Serratia fonticola]NYA36593.1 hypothetical protein [Serratia fonticola]
MKKLKHTLLTLGLVIVPISTQAIITYDVTDTQIYLHPSSDRVTSSPGSGFNGISWNATPVDQSGQYLFTTWLSVAQYRRNTGESNVVSVDTILLRNTLPNPYTFPQAQRDAMQRYPNNVRICLMGYGGGGPGWLASCVLYPRVSTTTCALAGANSIDFGTLPAGQVSDNGNIWTVSCTNPTTVTVTVTNLAATSSTVELDAAKGVTAGMSIANADGLTGITFTTGTGTTHPFAIMAHLVTQPTTPGGAYTGNAIIVATWA